MRSYRPDPVEPAALARVVDAFRRGPSAGFSQGVHLVVVTDPALRTAIAQACGEAAAVARGLPRWLSVPPVQLLPCVREADYRARYAAADKRAGGRRRGPDAWAVPFWWVDAGAAWSLLALAAIDEGLATGFCDLGDRGAVRDLLQLPDDVAPVGLITLGHPLPETPTTSHRRGRRPREEVVHDGVWGRPWTTAPGERSAGGSGTSGTLRTDPGSPSIPPGAAT